MPHEFSSSAKRSLQIKQLRLMIHLGCHAEEREVPQPVDFSLQFSWNEAQPAEQSDQIDQALCYESLCLSLKKDLLNKEYRLVESLGREALKCIWNSVPDETEILLEVHKLRPPIEALSGGVVYQINELKSSKHSRLDFR